MGAALVPEPSASLTAITSVLLDFSTAVDTRALTLAAEEAT